MKYNEFMFAVIELYGEYKVNPETKESVLKTVTARYIKERWEESELDGVFKKLILKKSSKYKTPPDPAEFEELFPRRSIEGEALYWWEEINKNTSYMRDCMIGNIAAQCAIETMGGWIKFCTRLITDENGKDLDYWTRKQFIDLFKLYTDNPPEKEIKVLFGASTSSDEVRRKKMVLIGDRSLITNILENKSNPAMKAIAEMSDSMRLGQ